MESTSSTFTLPYTMKDFFKQDRVQSSTFKTSTIVIGILAILVGGFIIVGILLPNSVPHRLFDTLNKLEKVLIATSSLIFGGVLVSLGASAIYANKGTSINQSFIDKLDKKSTKWIEAQNGRSYMEDTHDSDSFEVHGKKVFITGVFDGHGDGGPNGASVAIMLRDQMKKILKDMLLIFSPNGEHNIKMAIRAACQKMDKEIEKQKTPSVGSCAAIVLIIEDLLFAINVGDCRIVLSQNEKAVPLSRDAKVSDPEFQEKIKERGGFISTFWGGKPRANGQLAVASSFGDYDLLNDKGQKVISSDPEIQVVNTKELKEGDCIILASDGLWDAVSSEEAVQIASAEKDGHNAAQKLLNTAIEKGSTDNITIGVLFF